MKSHVDPSLQLAGCRFVSRQLSRLMKYLQGAKAAADIEDIHQSRVACRRLRSALQVFSDCFDDEKLQTWNKQIKKLLKSFGAARDLDVQLEFLQQVLDGVDAEHRRNRPGLKRMMLRWQAGRDAVQPAVIKAVDRAQKEHVLMNIHLEVERIMFGLRHQEVPAVSAEILQRARGQIQDRMVDLIGRRSCLAQPEAVPEHHAMRISGKKLRYTMEIFDAVLDGKLRGPIKKVKKIQTLLGDLHDCDIWDEDIAIFIDQEKQRTVEYYGNGRPFSRILPGLEYLRDQRRQRRGELLEEARIYFEKLEGEKFWDTFLECLADSPKHKKKPEAQQDVSQSDTNQETKSEPESQPEQPENSDPV
ncbi:MAG: CHAD domain-containing protein [Planctomycetota bacterium]|jgi:CHAD domain-containing protein